jgi:homoserine kinase type II
MSVYTPLQRVEIEDFLRGFQLAHLVQFAGVEAGIENTNYRLQLADGSVWFLTLFEHQSADQLPYFMHLLDHLGQQGCKVANPLKNLSGELFSELHGKPAALFPGKAGRHPDTISPTQAHAAGAALAQVHKAGEKFPLQRANDRGYPWIAQVLQRGLVHLNKHDTELMDREIQWLATALHNWADLPHGICHGDLFPDNVLFNGADISALLDFYNASTDVLAYDLAICLNAWCARDTTLATAMIAGYTTERVLETTERTALPALRRLAALRFWVSRLIAQEHQKSASATTFKDPLEMCELLLWLQNH